MPAPIRNAALRRTALGLSLAISLGVAGLATESHGAASSMPTREAVKARFG